VSAERRAFYARTVRSLVRCGVLHSGMQVLVVAGGAADRDVLLEFGFRNVTITNVDEIGCDHEPYRWEREDAETLTYANELFDWTIVSAGLHHCLSPHRALLELYRVARHGVLVLESRDSVLVRAAIHLGLIDQYELTAVAAHDFRAGGVHNGPVPNYVFRWTEREVEKTIASYAPYARHTFLWFHDMEFPLSIFDVCEGRRHVARVLRSVEPAARLLARILPRQGNLLAFAILKPELPRDLQPWLQLEDAGPAPNAAWIRRRLGS
jgi:ubiquinone/menaquinone biosynthesis C-methylase UbiE